MSDTAIESPRLRALADQVASDGGAALGAFWREIEVATTPLIESDPGSDRACLVTFLWRETEPLNNVLLIEWLTAGDLPTKRMTKLPGTDCWYRTFRLRRDVRTEYSFLPNDSLVSKWEETDWERRWATIQPDPLNPKRLTLDPLEPATTRRQTAGSIVELPDAQPLPWVGARDGVPAGRVTKHRFASPLLGNERDVWSYQPTLTEGRQPEGLLVHFDGERAHHPMGIPTLLDNLIADGAIPPLVAVMIGNVNRGQELPCNPTFARFLAEEIAPWARSAFAAPADPECSILAGQSYGGLAALYGALHQSETFGKVVSQSGSFWWKPNPLEERATFVPGDAPEYATLPGEVARMAKRPVTIYLDAGTLENQPLADGVVSLLQSNRQMRDVLIAKGYDVIYHEFAGGHDYCWWRGRLADGLIAVVGG